MSNAAEEKFASLKLLSSCSVTPTTYLPEDFKPFKGIKLVIDVENFIDYKSVFGEDAAWTKVAVEIRKAVEDAALSATA